MPQVIFMHEKDLRVTDVINVIDVIDVNDVDDADLRPVDGTVQRHGLDLQVLSGGPSLNLAASGAREKNR